MSTRRKRATAKSKHASDNVPPYYYYPQYGYIQPPVYNPAYMQPPPLYQNPEYIYYPVNASGEILGAPATFPPIVNQRYQEPYPYFDYMSNLTTRGSYIHSPRRDPRFYDDYHYYRHDYPSYPDRSYEKSRRESLPPISRHPVASTRLASPNYDQYQQFVVRDLTERSSVLSKLSNRDAMRRMEHYDKLRKSYR